MNIFPEREIFEKPPQLGYFHGEENVEKYWKR
jgi:hypothetical protein